MPNKLVVLRYKSMLLIFKQDIPEYHDDDDVKYRYNEGTCPTNFVFHNKDGLVIDLDTLDPDPHGIFQYVTTLDDVDFELAGMQDSEILETFKDVISQERVNLGIVKQEKAKIIT